MSIKRQVGAVLPTPYGVFKIFAFAVRESEVMPHIVLVHEHFDSGSPVHLRIHSECLTGDLFGSFRCDCGEQLHVALEMVGKEAGVIVYLRQEGRGIGIVNKLKAYNLQDEGLNTAEANTHLGFEADPRIYNDAIEILQDLGIKEIHLITNNPDKVAAFDTTDINVVSRVPLLIPPRPENISYYKTKKDIFGHSLEW
jgi:GTP cyclohydrolase II